MSPPRIFISHSAKDAPELLWQLHDAFEAAGYRVLMDKARLGPGADWRNEIYTWIHRAHGAVILLSEAACRSEWVHFEISALAPRRWLEPDFPLVPVLVPPITEALFREKRFEPFDLARLQAAIADCSDVVRRVVDTFAPLLRATRETRIDRLATIVSNELPRDEYLLSRAARVLDPSVEEVERAGLARSLFHAEAEKIRDAVAEVAGGMSRSQVKKVIDITVPFWIDPQSIVELIREAAQPAGPHHILLLTSGATHIGKMYAHRAALQYPVKWAVVSVTDAGGDDFVGAIVSEIRDWFRSIDELLADASDAEIDRAIANTAKSDPVVVILPPGTNILNAAALRNRYPECILIMLSRRIPDEAVLVANKTVVLEPRLDTTREDVITKEWLACGRLVRSIDD
jgi:hypothetical protein